MERWEQDHVVILRALQKAQHAMGTASFIDGPKIIPKGSVAYVNTQAFTHITPTKLTRRFQGSYTVAATRHNSITF